ncbi:hypothetical protein BP5796_03559 [Coleophoma crateriformis]|uniref:Uncharacterized protein n=1 Tax=Coleophoma crateriformis TaxID=565419 RepID=A0A3D8SNG4_9HELO|nr:hypothetical protein BP5796_03559 [Coleophoma crateriformis]
MHLASGIEPLGTARAPIVTGQVLSNSQEKTTAPAQDRFFIARIAGPDLRSMARERRVAVDAGVELVAAFVLDGDDVERGMVMCALGLRGEGEAMHDGFGHCGGWGLVGALLY